MTLSTSNSTNGFFAGLIVFLISVAIGSFCTAIQYYACSAILVMSLGFWINFLHNGVKRKRAFAVVMMMLYSIALEVILFALIGLFVLFSVQPGYGPFCKGNSTITSEAPHNCGILGNTIMVIVFVAFATSNFFSLVFLKRFRFHLLQAQRRRRHGAPANRDQLPTICSALAPPTYSQNLPSMSTYVPPPPYIEYNCEDILRSLPKYDDIIKAEAEEETDTRV